MCCERLISLFLENDYCEGVGEGVYDKGWGFRYLGGGVSESGDGDGNDNCGVGD